MGMVVGVAALELAGSREDSGPKAWLISYGGVARRASDHGAVTIGG